MHVVFSTTPKSINISPWDCSVTRPAQNMLRFTAHSNLLNSTYICMHSFYLKSCPNSAGCTYTKESLHCAHTGKSGLQELPQGWAGSRCPQLCGWRGGGRSQQDWELVASGMCVPLRDRKTPANSRSIWGEE